MAKRRRPGAKVKATEGRALATLRRLAFTRGVLGGSRGWTSVAVGLWGYRKLKGMAARQEQVVYSGTLQPGQRLLVSNGPDTVGDAVEGRRRRRRS